MTSIQGHRLATLRQMRFVLLFVILLQPNMQSASGCDAKATRPNILLIMADDLGFSDLGCYGSEIETPCIDQLADDGIKFTRFRATPMCVTSRIALMAGMPLHAAGRQRYRHAIPLASLLKSGGYRTAMTGKWHGGSPDPRSTELFDRSFGFLGGSTDSFVGGDDWFLNDKPFRKFSEGFYSSHAFADRSIEFMKEAVERRQPFFMYVAFNAPHHPCQAPQATVEKYRDVYRSGYQGLRKERREKQQQLGLIDPQWPLADVGLEVREWSELSDHRKEVEVERMAAYAAAIDEVDQSVGRMLEFLDDARLAENTLVIFLSDNGGDYSNGAIATDQKQTPWKAGTNPSSSNGWASVKCTPFRYYKHSCHEGGLATPMVMRWPAGISEPDGSVFDVSTNITDLYPTMIDLAEIDYPTKWQGESKRPLSGTSLVPLLKKQGVHKTRPVFQWYSFSRAWIEDEWKAVQLYEGPWQLFNLKTDRCEAIDLAEVHSDRLKQMIGKWNRFAAESGVPISVQEATEIQRGWGWHRLQKVAPALTSTIPANGSVTKSTKIEFQLSFLRRAIPQISKSRTVKIYDVAQENRPVWTANAEDVSLSPDGKTVVFKDLPQLAADRHYSVRWDHGWASVAGKPIKSLNDGAFWWRFRTPAVSN